MAIQPIPEGQRTLTPHLSVSDAARAIEFYKAAFGAEERSRAATPDGKIMHADLQIGDSHLFLSDQFGPPGPVGSGITIHVWAQDARAMWDRAVKAGATVKMPLAVQFWGDLYGHLVDPFGHMWSVAQHVEDVPPAELPMRAAKAFGQH